MLNPILAGRYAKTLIDIAQTDNSLESIYTDMVLLQKTCKGNAELTNLLRSPIINTDKKEKILTAIFGSHLHKTTMLFIDLMVRKGRENLLDEVANAFIEQYRTIKNIFKVKITTASAVSPAMYDYLLEKIKSTLPKTDNIELECDVKSDLIGGFILESKVALFDASILKGMKEVQRQFRNNEYMYNIR
jgi:F-type H+-transporting ATPase subunit delta